MTGGRHLDRHAVGHRPFATRLQPRPVMLSYKARCRHSGKEVLQMAAVMFARTGRSKRQGAARPVAPGRSGAVTRRPGRLAICAVSAVAVTLPVGVLGTGAAQAATTAPHALATGWTPLTLQNGWTNSPFGTSAAAVRTISGIVHLKGAIATTGTNPVPFTLPAGFRPAHVVFVAVDLCNATHGVLQIEPAGVVTVQAEGGAFSNAACFTSLDGASFAKSASSFTPLTLQNGWFNSPFGTSAPAVRTISGIVHLKGAIATSGTNPVPFTLPAAFRPASVVFVPVDLCTATNGRLQIEPTGVVTVEAEGGAFSNAACFTSLDGASFAP
jgi:hypothetical protein